MESPTTRATFPAVAAASMRGRAVGAIRFKGENLLALPPDGLRHVRGNQISMIFQEPMTSLNPCFTVGFQLTEGIKVHEGGARAQRRGRAIEPLPYARTVEALDYSANVSASET